MQTIVLKNRRQVKAGDVFATYHGERVHVREVVEVRGRELILRVDWKTPEGRVIEADREWPVPFGYEVSFTSRNGEEV